MTSGQATGMTKWAWLGHGALVASLCAFALSAAAQTNSPPAQPAARAWPAQGATLEVAAVRDAVEHAHFDDAQGRAHALLASTALSARERNDTLELLAVAQIAARREVLAQATLSELFARDPEHPQRMRDPGPNVEAFFARVRAARRPSLSAALQVAALRDDQGRVLIQVGLGDAHDAIQTVHVFCRAGAAGGAVAPPDETSQVVAEVGAREQLQLALPAFSSHVDVLALWLEARAPSGLVLAHDGSASEPLRVHLEPAKPNLESRRQAPLLRKWWLWTSVAIVVAGLGVTGALVAH